MKALCIHKDTPNQSIIGGVIYETRHSDFWDRRRRHQIETTSGSLKKSQNRALQRRSSDLHIFTPTTSPFKLNSGPPEFPGLDLCRRLQQRRPSITRFDTLDPLGNRSIQPKRAANRKDRLPFRNSLPFSGKAYRLERKQLQLHPRFSKELNPIRRSLRRS